MNTLIIIVIFTLVLAFLMSKIAKFINWIFFKPKKAVYQNPYIEHHKIKMQNDMNYDEYLEWLNKVGEGVPMDKVLSPEDRKADLKIKKMI